MAPQLLALALAAAALSYLGTGRFRSWAEKRLILDVPNDRSLHAAPTARGAGLVIVVVTLAGLWSFVLWNGDRAALVPLSAYTAAAALVAGVSWLDDLRSLRHWIRLGAQVASASLVLALVGSWQRLPVPFGGEVDPGWIGPLLTLLWIVGLTNAYNFMDGIDGIAGVQSVVAGVGWALVGVARNQPEIAALGLLAAAASAGFLRHNWPPARIFMGDVGSAFLGFTFAALPLLYVRLAGSQTSADAPVLAVVMVWPFLFDTVFTFFRRLFRGENVFEAHKSHLYQRLVSAGHSHRTVTLIYGALAASGVLLGRAWSLDPLRERWGDLAAIPGLALILWFVVADHERAQSPGAGRIRAHLLRYRRVVIVLSQAFLLTLAYYASFLLRLDFTLPEPYRASFLKTLPVVLLIKLLAFSYFRLFSGWWRYVGMSDLLDITRAAALSAPLVAAAVYWLHGLTAYPRSIFIIDPILTLLVIGGARFAVRAYYESARVYLARSNTLIVGAGRAGASIARELKNNERLDYNPIGFVDDDPTKRGIKVEGIKVLGSTDDLARLITERDVAHLLIAIPSARGRQIQRILDKCRECRVDFKTLPALGDVIRGAAFLDQVRSVRLEDLLLREPVRLESAKIREKFQNKTVLITGAAGSIGAELARQLAAFGPAKLVILDRSESDLYETELEIRERHPSLAVSTEIGDVLDVKRLREVFSAHAPRSVFHAAAYKHVPMMERHCLEAVTNNVFGTRNVARIAQEHGTEDFVLISTDKAVHPSSVMGVTKRIAEIVILGLQDHGTRLVAVRFGNVLGSRGSVVPLFQRQIAQRRPVTITHPDVTRYFMTIPEASQLVLQASTMGNGGEIFVLDMGEPVRIVDLARTLIRLSGLEPDKDIPIVFTAMRPGEKLYEDLRLDVESIKPTTHEKIRVFDGGTVDPETVGRWLRELESIVESRDAGALIRKLSDIVPEYTPSPDLAAEQAESEVI